MNPNTALAMDTFKKLLRAERRVDTLRNELSAYVRAMPPEDVEEYMRVTQEMVRTMH